ncbi:hypothetical protein TrVE_jg8504 [Triparma verrucosa]|uniref:Uncharacterized protein n=1 Tax=Triparma verrucosa TaxID=1606542 RepID=A0A9W7BZ24_9STRA|nr:hypothetical protein TrVE_jg8504 [Triparma verrucosa]
MSPLQWLPSTYSYSSQLHLMSSRKSSLKVYGYRLRLKTWYRLYALLLTTSIPSITNSNYSSIRKRMNLNVVNIPGESHLNFNLQAFKVLASLLMKNAKSIRFPMMDYNDIFFDTCTPKDLHLVLRRWDRHGRARFLAGITEIELRDFMVSRPGLVWKVREEGRFRNMKWNEMFGRCLEFTETEGGRGALANEVQFWDRTELKKRVEEDVKLPWEALKFYNHTGPGRRKAMKEEEMEELARKLLTEYYTWFDDDFTLDPNEPLGINVKKFPMKGMGWDVSFRPTSYAAPLTESLKQSLSSKSGVLISDEVPEQTKKDILESKINSTKRHKFKPEFFEKPKGDPASASKRWSYEKDEYVEEDRSYAGISTASTYKVSGSNLTKEEKLEQIRNPNDAWRKKQATIIEEKSRQSTPAPQPVPPVRQEPWIKQQQRKILEKFAKGEGEGDEKEEEEDFEVQDEWLAMERRTKNRRLVRLDEAGEKLGRQNVKKTDEEYWLQAGVYDEGDTTRT